MSFLKINHFLCSISVLIFCTTSTRTLKSVINSYILARRTGNGIIRDDSVVDSRPVRRMVLPDGQNTRIPAGSALEVLFFGTSFYGERFVERTPKPKKRKRR